MSARTVAPKAGPQLPSAGPQASRLPARVLQRRCACGGQTHGGEECEACKQKRRPQTLQRATRTGIDGAGGALAPASVDRALQSSGVPLDSGTRSDLEPRFAHNFTRVQAYTGGAPSGGSLAISEPGDQWERNAGQVSSLVLRDRVDPRDATDNAGVDLSQVRVHTDDTASRSARDVGARAYTVGQHIVFDQSEYQPGSSAGRELLTHELTHVLQQAPTLRRQPKPSAEPAVCIKKPPEGRAEVSKDGAYRRWATVLEGDTQLSWIQRGFNDWLTWRFGSAMTPALRTAIIQRTAHRPSANFQLRVGCQQSVRILNDHLAWIIKLVGAEQREREHGLPTSGDDAPAHEVGADQGTPGQDQQARGGEKGEGKQGDGKQPPVRGYGDEFLSGTGQAANLPAYPAQIAGPDIQPTGGTGAYTMKVDYSIAGELIFQLAEAFNVIYYYWEIYDITALAKKGQSAMIAQQQRQAQLSAQAAKATEGATGRAADRAVDELKEQAAESARGLVNPAQGNKDAPFTEKTADVFANYENLVLLPVSAITELGGLAVRALADLAGGTSQEREIPWPQQQGVYLLRCIAQPSPRGRDKQFRRAPSVAVKVVEVRPIERLAEEGQKLPEVLIAEKQLELVIELRKPIDQGTPVDQARVDQINKEIADLQRSSSGSAVDALDVAIARKDAELKDLSGYRLSKAKEELADLRKQKVWAEHRISDFTGQVFRPRATFVSSLTGQTYPLLLQIGLLSKGTDTVEYRLSDVTNRDGKYFDGTGKSPGAAITAAVAKYANDAFYGNGLLVLRMPQEYADKNGALEISKRCASTSGPAVLKKRLNDLVTVLVAAGLFIPGVGEVAAVLGAGLAVERLIERALAGTLRVDAAAVSDMIAILGAVGQGAAVIGKLRVVRAPDLFALAASGADQAAIQVAVQELKGAVALAKRLELVNKLVGYGGFAWGSFDSAVELAKLNQAELNGDISHADARRQRAERVAGWLQNGIITFAGPKIQEHLENAAKAKVAQAEKTAPPRQGGQPPTKTAPETAAPEKITPSDPNAPEKLDPKAVDRGVGGPVTGNERVAAEAPTPDGLHHIFILDDGRIIRCSGGPGCELFEQHYNEFLTKNRPESSPRRKTAEELQARLTQLKADAAAAKKKPQREAVAKDLAQLEQAIRKFAAGDLATELGVPEAGVARALDVLNPEQLRAIRTRHGQDSLNRFLSEANPNVARLVAQAFGVVSDAAEAQLFQLLRRYQQGAVAPGTFERGLRELADLQQRYTGRTLTADVVERLLTGTNAPRVSGKNVNLPQETAGTGGIRSITGQLALDGSLKVTVLGRVLDTINRLQAPNFNDPLITGALLKLTNYQKLHLFGPGLGDEAAAGIFLGPRSANLSQQKVIEGTISRAAAEVTAAGGELHLSATATTHPSADLPANLRAHQFLATATYDILLVAPGGQPHLIGRIGLEISPPPNGRVTRVFAEGIDPAYAHIFEGVKPLDR